MEQDRLIMQGRGRGIDAAAEHRATTMLKVIDGCKEKVTFPKK